MPGLRTIISIVVLQIAPVALLFAQAAPAVDSPGTIDAVGGETGGIVYHRYRDLADPSAGASVRVWRLVLIDGAAFFGDSDPYPTIIDSLRIGVSLGGVPAAVPATRSIAWAGIYTAGPAPVLIATARIVRDSLLFEGIASRGLEAEDNRAAGFELRLKFVDSATVGDRFVFSLAARDVVAARNGSSPIASFSRKQSASSGDLNQLVTTGLRLVVSSAFPDSVSPGVPFNGAISILDSLENVIVGSSDSPAVISQAEAGELTGTSATVDSLGMFGFDSLRYSLRNDSLVLCFSYPGADTLRVVMVVTGGAATLPTVAHIRPDGPVRRRIDGTGIVVEGNALDGVFLFERIESVPPGNAPLPAGTSVLLNRYVRVSGLGNAAVRDRFLLGLPIDSLSFDAHPASLRFVQRRDELSQWNDPSAPAARFDAENVYAMVESIGEIAFGTNVDRAVPVTGVTLTGESVPGGRRLRWRTASEIGTAGFVVRRAVKRGGEYVILDGYRTNPRLEGRGYSATGDRYEWTDNDPSPAGARSLWYMLVDVSFDGIETEHGPVEIMISESKPGDVSGSTVAVHPNPCSVSTTFTVDGEIRGVIVVTLYDARGAVVARREFPDGGAGARDLRFETVGLATGLYRYTLEHDGGVSQGSVMIIAGE